MWKYVCCSLGLWLLVAHPSAAEEAPDQFMRTSDWLYDKVVDPEASEREREFCAKTLRFALTGLEEDFQAISTDINQAYSKAMEFGRAQLRLLLTRSYVERADLYYRISQKAQAKEEAQESLDTILKAVFYDSNNWLYWAEASRLFTRKWENEAVYGPSKGLLYGRLAVALNPRDPFAYWGLACAHFHLDQHSDCMDVCSKALELSKFESAHYSNWKSDGGRAIFTGLKGQCLLAMNDFKRAREYLNTALELNPNLTWAKDDLAKAMAPYEKEAKILALGDSKLIGYQSNEEGGRATLTQITADTPAERAGLQVDDVIVTVDGLPAVDKSGKSRTVQARDAILQGKQEKTLIEVRRGNQMLYFLMRK